MSNQRSRRPTPRYNGMCRRELWSKYGAHQHWAKIEPPTSQLELMSVQRRLAERFPLSEFSAARRELDPKGIMANRLVNVLLDGGEDRNA